MAESRGIREQQLERVLLSPVFQSSKQLRHFLEFTATRALEGEANVSQFEIAAEVLGKADFDPTVDASVRKLATQVRQRLEKYYDGPGREDDILITLPLRSYSPHFEPRTKPSPQRNWRWLAVGIAGIAFLLALGWKRESPQADPEGVRFATAFGDLRPPNPDPAPGGLRLSAPLGNEGELTTRLTFSPVHEGQYAGLVLWEGPRRYITLGRRFTSRNVISLATDSSSIEIADLDGQSDQPVWLKLRRRGELFTAFTSMDANHWTAVGEPMALALSAGARAGVFAVNGRRQSPSIPVAFHFTSRTPQWRFSTTCAGGEDLTSGLPSAGQPCESSFAEDAPDAPGWSFTARVDVDDSPAISAGLFFRSRSGPRLRLVRYRTDLPTIALIRDGQLLESIPDFPGRPPVSLRLAHNVETGKVEGFASVDGLRFIRVGTPVEGASGQVGLIASRRLPVTAAVPATARFLSAWQDLKPLEPIPFVKPQ